MRAGKDIKYRDDLLALNRTAVDVLYRAVQSGYTDQIDIILKTFFMSSKAYALRTVQMFIEQAENDPVTMPAEGESQLCHRVH
jgi:hypothetical protein